MYDVCMYVSMYVCIGSGPVGQFSLVSSTQKDDVTITIIKNEVEKRFVRIETRKGGGHGDGKEGMQGIPHNVYVCMYVCIMYILCMYVCMYILIACMLSSISHLMYVCMYKCMYVGQGMSTTMAGNYFFVSVDRKVFATDDSVYQAILSHRPSPSCDG